jgi:hypothetical protein
MTLPENRVLKFVLMLAAISLGACAYRGGVDNPLARKFNWFSYVAGDDLKASCKPGAPAQYRLVYNADWNQQVRAYDLRASLTNDGSAMLFTEVFGGYGSNVSSFSMGDVFGPARGSSGQQRLTPEQYQAIVQALNDSGFMQPAPKGLRLESWDYYWIVSGCTGGQFHFNAWRYPSETFSAIKFDKLLFAADGVNVPVNPPRPVNSAEQYTQQEFPRSRSYGGTSYTFELMVGENGLAGRLPPL